MKGFEQDISCRECTYSCIKEIFADEHVLLFDKYKSKMAFKAGESIIKQGTFVSQIAYLKSGIVKKILESKNNRNTILKIIEETNFFALPVLGNHEQYPFSVVAVTDCVVCFIKKDAVSAVMHKDIKANQSLLNWFSDDYFYMYSKMDVISTRNSHGKVASTLLYLTHDDFKSNMLKILSRKEIAELSGTSLESTNKILQELNHDRIIEIEKKDIIINRRDLLEKLSTVG